MTNCRVLELEVEKNGYGEAVDKADFDPDFYQEVDDMDFKLNDEPVTKSFGSRMNKKARAGVIKPTGSVSSSVDLQRIGHFFYGYLDNYKFTEGSNNVNTHEFWGGEHKKLQSFRGIAAYDELVFYIYGLLVDGFKFECSSEDMTLSTDFVYKTEEADILEDGEALELAEELANDLFVMFYDIFIKLDDKDPEGTQTSFSFEGSNNHNVDGTLGFGSRHPQKQPNAQKRENSLSLVTTLTEETMKSILAARYGKVNVFKPTRCEILQVPLELEVKMCEYPDLGMTILFPNCTLQAEFDVSGADDVETTLNMATLGSATVKLLDKSEVATDMYVKLVNNMGEIGKK